MFFSSPKNPIIDNALLGKISCFLITWWEKKFFLLFVKEIRYIFGRKEYFCRRCGIISTVIFFISILSYFIVVFIMSFFPVFYNYDNFYEIILDKLYYFSSLLVISLCALVDIAVSKCLLYYGIVENPIHCAPESSMNQFDVESIEEDVTLLVDNEK